MLTLCGETDYICIYMMVVYLCGKTDTKLCVVKQSIYVYIYVCMMVGYLQNKQYVCVYIWVYKMMIDKSPPRLLVSPVWQNWAICAVKQMLTLCGETEHICIHMHDGSLSVQ